MDKEQKGRPVNGGAQEQRRRQPGAKRPTAPGAGTARAGQRPAAPQAAPRRPEQQRGPQHTDAQPGSQRRRDQQRPSRPAAQPEHPAAKRSIQLGGAHMRSARQRTPQEQKVAREQRSRMAAQAAATDDTQERTLKKNTLHSFISGNRNAAAESDREQRAKERQKQREQRAERKRRQAARDNTPAVIYTQPAAFNRNRLLVQLMTVTAVVVALVVGMSIFFKVGVITVAGAQVYDPYTIQQASGIKHGDNLLTFSRARAGAQIRAELGYVDTVRIGIKLPDTVIIYIEEFPVSYAIKSSDGDWWLINSDGRVVEQVDGTAASGYTQVLGVTIADPVINEQAVATELAVAETDPTAETAAPVMVTGAQRLHSALQILKALEANDIVGEAASVDVSILESVVLWYGSRYQVNLGDTSRMEYKIAYMKGAILELSEYQSGILDVSFTVWPNQAGYTPFG